VRNLRHYTFLSRYLRLGVYLSVITIFGSEASGAQAPPGLDPTGRSGQPPPLSKEEPGSPAKPSLILPPVPTPAPEEKKRTPLERIFIRKIRVTGSTVFSPEEIAQLTAPYENREITFQDLEAARLALTVHYINHGYINSGAVIPDQTITDGVVTLVVIEGQLSRIELAGNRWFRNSYIRDRLSLGVGKPFDVNALRENMQLLLEDSRFERLNGALRPGINLGESTLDVTVEERNPFKLQLVYNNYQSPTIGSNQGLVVFEHQNVFGFGDVFRAEHGGTSGLYPEVDIRYTFPFTARDTTLSFNYRKNDAVVIETPFNPLDIRIKSDIFGLTLRQPVYRRVGREFALEVIGERLQNKTSLLGHPFSFYPGVENGKSVVTALRFAQEWIDRSASQVIAARSRFSFGIDALGATINSSDLPDGRFFSWLGQFQWARRWPFWGIETLWRTDIQLADDPLFPLEQIVVGGRYSVRGYREDFLVRDNAAINSFEVRIPLVAEQPWADYLQLAPFFDIGYAWNNKLPTLEPRTIYSAGIGIRWAATFIKPVPIQPQFEIYWGHPFKKVDTPGGNLQDHGLHLQFVLALF